MGIKFTGVTRRAPVHGYRVSTANYKGKFTLDEAAKRVVEFQKEAQKRNEDGEISVNLLLPNKDETKAGRWISATKFTNINENLDLTNFADVGEDYFGHLQLIIPEHFFGMQIHVSSFGKNNKMGASDPYNDCFYNCLVKEIPDIVRKDFPSARDFKYRLGLKRDEKVPFSKIPEIEQSLGKYKITVMGEHQYISQKSAPYTITLYLNREHVYRIPTKTLSKQKQDCFRGYTEVERVPLFFRNLNNDKNQIKFYQPSSNNFKLSTHEFRKEVRMKPFDYNFFFIQTKNGESLKSSYEQFMANAQIIKQLTNGKYNLLKSGSIMKAVLHRFYHLNQHLVVEPIEIDEADWLNKAFKGGIIFAQSGYKGNGIEYDFNAFYASILASQNFSFPITKGSFVIMSEQEFSQLKFFRFGIYRVEITNINHRLFKHNGDNYYTHFDLTRAKELGYPIKLIQDGKPNALLYDGNGKRVNGDVCFKPMVNELYELKKQYGKKYPIIKQLLLLIWGGLCEHKKHIHSRKLSNYTPVDDEEPAVLVSIVDAGDYTHFHTKSLAFNSDFGRLGVFLTSRARQIISRTMEPHIDKIVRCHTDGFISRSELQWPKSAKVEIGTDLGHLKFEGQWSSLHIVNANKIINLETGNSYKK